MAGRPSSRKISAPDGDDAAPKTDDTMPHGRQLTLVVVGPAAGSVGSRHALDTANLLVGRASDNDLVLDEASVSARHARIDVEPDGAFITDLGSTNGTFLDGRQVRASVELTAGSTLQLGRCEMRVEAGGAPSPERSEGEATVAAPVLADGTVIGELEAGGGPARTGATITTRRPLRILASFDRADEAVGNRIVERLERVGHTVLVDRSVTGDGWSGRLLDAMWSCDAAVFVVSAAAARSERVHREIHLAGAEHTTVVPVVVGEADLPDDLAYYVDRRPGVDLRSDEAAGLSELQLLLDGLAPKRIARPWRLARRLVAAAVLILLVYLAYRFVTG
jgi:hypothetical protein